MNLNRIFLISFILALASVVNGQTSVKCGIVGIDGPTQVEPGTPIVFKVKVTSMPENPQPEFKWFLYGAEISKGQGTDGITIDTAKLAGFVLTATVELQGAPSGCHSVESITAGVNPLPPPRSAFDAYGDIKLEDEQARLDNFAIQISNYPGSRGLILMSAGQQTYKGEAWYRLELARAYLVKVRGVEANRIETRDCGFTPELTVRLWIIPPGTKFPQCNTVGQIPLSKVEFTKPRPAGLN